MSLQDRLQRYMTDLDREVTLPSLQIRKAFHVAGTVRGFHKVDDADGGVIVSKVSFYRSI